VARGVLLQVARSWNPIVGCSNHCVYCWARAYAERLRERSRHYRAPFERPRLILKRLNEAFKPGEVIFAVDMGDLFCDAIPDDWIRAILKAIARNPRTTFILLTKNPKRYLDFIDEIPGNVVLGATVETYDDELYVRHRISRAPPPSERLKAMRTLEWPRKFVCVEPILDFPDAREFAYEIASTGAELAYIGYDNYGHRLPEPELGKTYELLHELEELGVEVELGTIRRAWWEATA